MIQRCCVTCGSQRRVKSAGGREGADVWACPAHLQGLRGQPADLLDDLTWLQETRLQRMLDRRL